MSGAADERPKYAFYGSGRFAARCLELLTAWTPPCWIATAPPKEAGRGKKLAETPVAAFVRGSDALSGIPLLESSAVSRDDAVLAVREKFTVDFSFVIDFGQIVREPILEWGSSTGCLNIHPSLLPRYRGAAPVQRALMDGLEVTGVTIFKLAGGVDCGPILLQKEVAVGPEDDAGALLERCACAGVAAFIEYADGTPLREWRFREQDESAATYAPKISPEEERIDWSRAAGEILGRVRALSPKPGAWTTIGGKRLRVLSASIADGGAEPLRPGELATRYKLPVVGTGSGCLALGSVQMEGKKIQSAAQWWNGFRAAEGAFFI